MPAASRAGRTLGLGLALALLSPVPALAAKAPVLRAQAPSPTSTATAAEAPAVRGGTPSATSTRTAAKGPKVRGKASSRTRTRTAAKRPAVRVKGPGRTSTLRATTAATGWTYHRVAAPDRTLVKDAAGALLATFTDGSRSVVLAGPERTFSESTTTAAVRTTSWVRLLPAPATAAVDPAWLAAALSDTSPDVLAVAAQYATGATTVRASDGSLVSSDASYGPLVDGKRQEGSDWNDYLQVSAAYDGAVDTPEAEQAGALDCSGFVRMVFGRRLGVPLTLQPDGVRLPRRATQMHTAAPGTLVADATSRLADLSRLLPGDLVLFDASPDDGAAVDHVGIYLGRDSAGHPRFVSSRKTVDGPTLGDVGGRSTLDGTGLYATSLRALRRL